MMSVDDVKKMLKSKSMIIGAERVLKALRNNELAKIFLASNAPESLVKDVGYYASLAKVEVEQLGIPNDELGVICKKPFSIACIGLKKTVEKKEKY